MQRRLTIGTRGSALARIQTDIAIRALKGRDPELAIDVRIIETQGDKNHQPIPLDTVGKGWFTQEIENALLHKEIDIAVHSLKDMADAMPEGLSIGAYLSREDARDVLVTKHGKPLERLRKGAIIGTDSLRRQVQIKALRPDVEVKSIRGNVPTRVEKLASQDYDAVILAAAGLKRLDMEDRITRYFEPDEMTPAPGQGVLALQSRADDAELNAILSAIEDPDVTRCAEIERSFSRVIGGGCKAPIGAYAYRDTDTCVLTGMIAAEDGTIIRDTIQTPWNESEDLGKKLADVLLKARDHAHA